MPKDNILPDFVLTERAVRMRLSGQWSVPELAAELGISKRTLYRALPACVKRGEIKVYSEEARERMRASFRRWHERMEKAGLPRDGSVTIRGGEVVRTGRVNPWPFVERRRYGSDRRNPRRKF